MCFMIKFIKMVQLCAFGLTFHVLFFQQKDLRRKERRRERNKLSAQAYRQRRKAQTTSQEQVSVYYYNYLGGPRWSFHHIGRNPTGADPNARKFVNCLQRVGCFLR